jgi:hypothetical protein
MHSLPLLSYPSSRTPLNLEDALPMAASLTPHEDVTPYSDDTPKEEGGESVSKW